jgi:hypothetical protein
VPPELLPHHYLLSKAYGWTQRSALHYETFETWKPACERFVIGALRFQHAFPGGLGLDITKMYSEGFFRIQSRDTWVLHVGAAGLWSLCSCLRLANSSNVHRWLQTWILWRMQSKTELYLGQVELGRGIS